MIVYIHNALLVPILHDYKYFNSLPFCHAFVCRLAQFKTNVTALAVWECGCHFQTFFCEVTGT